MRIQPTHHLLHLLRHRPRIIPEQLRIILLRAEYLRIDLLELTIDIRLIGALVEIDEEGVLNAHGVDVSAVGDERVVAAYVGGEFVAAEGAQVLDGIDVLWGGGGGGED
jgi:hypothetical protein